MITTRPVLFLSLLCTLWLTAGVAFVQEPLLGRSTGRALVNIPELMSTVPASSERQLPQLTDPIWIGTWELNLEESTGRLPASRTLRIETVQEGLRLNLDSWGMVSVEITLPYDGTTVELVSPQGHVATYSSRQLENNSFDLINSLKGGTFTLRFAVSADGTTLTRTTDLPNYSTLVFKRQ